MLIALDDRVPSLKAAYRDGLDLLEHAESLVGVGLVATQVYIQRAVADLRAVFSSCPKIEVLVRGESPMVANADVTYVEALWEAANYFKHHETWGDWECDLRPRTRDALRKLGLSKKTEFPCVEVLRRLQGDEWRLAPLLEVARNWREGWFRRLNGGAG